MFWYISVVMYTISSQYYDEKGALEKSIKLEIGDQPT